MFLCVQCMHSMLHSDMPTRGVRGHAPPENFLILLTPQMQFPAFWADFKSSLYVKSEVKDGEFTDSSVTIFNFSFHSGSNFPVSLNLTSFITENLCFIH